MYLFGKKKKEQPKPSSQSVALTTQNLRKMSEQLDKREVHLQKQIDECIRQAKLKSKRDKKGALFQLKRKKMIEKQRDQIYGKKMNLEVQILALENAQSNKILYQAMTEGKNALQATVTDADVENVEDMMDDLQEALQVVDNVGEAMSTPMDQDMDEDELNAELAELEEEMAQEEMAELNAPSVPTRKLQSPVHQQEEGYEPAVSSSDAKVPMSKEQQDLAELENMLAA